MTEGWAERVREGPDAGLADARPWRLRLVLVAAVFFVRMAVSAAAVASDSQPWNAPFNPDVAGLRAAANSLSPAEGADSEILFKEAAYVLDAKGRCTFRERTVVRLLSAAGVGAWQELNRAWAPWHQDRPGLRARVIDADGKAHDLDPKTIAEGPAGDESLELYSDRRIVRAPLPSLAAGAIVEEEYEVRERQAELAAGSIHSVFLRTLWPVRRVRLSVEAPASTSLRFSVRGIPASDVRREESGGNVRLTYEGGPFAPFEHWEPGMPEEVETRICFAFSTGRSWQEVAADYARIVDDQIRRGAAVLPEKEKSDASSARGVLTRLASRLHRQIRYTGVEFGDSAIVPTPPAETWKRGYGDCKDKAAVLVSLLREAGILAHVALLDAGPGPDVDPDLPGLGAFDHAIVVVEGKERIWIDATDEYGIPGQLPAADQGRWALVASASTRQLVRTPRAEARENGILEEREFRLSEFGPAHVLVRAEPSGSEERDYRRAYHRMKRKDLEKQLGSYASAIFLAKKIGRFDYSDPLDFSTRFRLNLDIPDARRGLTDENEAAVALLPAEWIEALPAVFRNEPNSETDEEKQDERRRRHDYVWTRPFTNEWRYHVLPPEGFAAAGLPESKTLALGPVTLTQEYRIEKDGSVSAIVRLTSGKPRISASEFEQVRSEAAKISGQNVIFLRFESVAARHVAAGRIREALAEYRRLAALHPRESLHHAQLAGALLKAGLGESARRQARQAIETEPDSALAHRTLGWVLQHDLLGRRFGKGFDRAGAIAEYRKSIELDASNEDGRANLAILLEHDAAGERYGDPAEVKKAVAEYQAIRRDLKSKTYDINLLIALLRSQDYGAARQFALELPHEPQRDQLLLAAVAAAEGSAAAIREATRLSTDPEPRRQALENAGRYLILLRVYEPAAALLSEAANGASKPGLLLTQAATVSKMRHYEDMALPPGDPTTVVRRLLISLLLPDRPDAAQPASLFASVLREAFSPKEEQDLIRIVRIALRRGGGGLPPAVILDAAFSRLTLTAEGSDASGFRIHGSGYPQADNQIFYVTREEGQYRLAAMTGADAAIGAEALSRASKGDLAGARQWLDWEREAVKSGTGDDPLGGPLLPRFWTKGSTAGLVRIRLAAASLMCTERKLAGSARSVLEDPAAEEEKDIPLEDFDLARAVCESSLRQWDVLQADALKLLASNPGSERAFRLAGMALARLGRWEEAEKLARERLARLPDDPVALESLTSTLLGKEDYRGVEKACLTLVAHGKATSMDYNNLAWNFLFTDGASEKAIEYAQQAVGPDERKNPMSLHTLATLYAELGKSAQARESLLESLEIRGLDEPEPHDWYVFGRIAESYGEIETAREDYGKVTRPEDAPLGGSTHLLAKARLARLGSAPPSTGRVSR